MTCSICNRNGHNSKTCPQLLPTSVTANQEDYAFWIRYGGFSKAQAKALKRVVEDWVDENAPDSYGVVVVGKEKRLPERIQQAIKGANPQTKLLESDSEDE